VAASCALRTAHTLIVFAAEPAPARLVTELAAADAAELGAAALLVPSADELVGPQAARRAAAPAARTTMPGTRWFTGDSSTLRLLSR
jgi:hypothetical protein